MTILLEKPPKYYRATPGFESLGIDSGDLYEVSSPHFLDLAMETLIFSLHVVMGSISVAAAVAVAPTPMSVRPSLLESVDMLRLLILCCVVRAEAAVRR